MPFRRRWQVDACYAGAEVHRAAGRRAATLGERALAKLGGRSKPVANWYLDMSMIQKYLVTSDFGTPRVYHHTAPISMVFAFREALQIVAEEGLENSWARHRDAGEFFWSELAKVGLEPHVAHEHRLPSLTTVKIPEDIDGAKVVTYLRENYDMEIAGGLGKLAGKVGARRWAQRQRGRAPVRGRAQLGARGAARGQVSPPRRGSSSRSGLRARDV